MSRPIIKFKRLRLWTDRDDEVLRALALSGAELEKIARELKRIASAVQQRATVLGLSLSRNLLVRRLRNRNAK